MSDFHKKKHRDTCCIAPKIKYHEDKFVFSPVFDDTETSDIKTFINMRMAPNTNSKRIKIGHTFNGKIWRMSIS